MRSCISRRLIDFFTFVVSAMKNKKISLELIAMGV